MRLVARLDKIGQARVEGYVRLPSSPLSHPITFLVDTGCSNSCILPDDAARLFQDHSALIDVTKTIVTANGPVSLKAVHGAEVVLPVRVGLLDNKLAYITFPMENLAVLPPSPGYKPLPRELVFILLGVDILKSFPKWTFGKESLVMENDQVIGLKMSFKL